MHERIYLATISDDAALLARTYGLGLELDDFCTAVNMDENFGHWDARTRAFLKQSSRCILHAPFAELSPCAIDPLIRDVARRRLLQAVQLCGRYGIQRMVVHSGFIPRVYFPEWFIEQGSAFFRDLLAVCPDSFHIMIENVLDPDPQPLLEMVAAIDDPRASVCLDVGHANVASRMPVTDWLRILSPKLSHLHLHDNDGSWDTHSVPGDGNIGFPALLEHIPKNATLTFECIDAAGCVRRLREYGILQA